MTSHLSVFDLDHTLLSENSGYQFSRLLYREKVLTFSSFLFVAWHYFRYLYLGLSFADLHQAIFNRVLLGLPPILIDKYVEMFVEESLPNILYMPAISELTRAQHLGYATAILSNSPDFLVKGVAKFFGVDEWKATSYTYDEKGNFSGIELIFEGEQKALYLQKLEEKLNIPKENVTAYSDSISDLPLLLQAGIPVAVTPDKKLQEYALSHDWRII